MKPPFRPADAVLFDLDGTLVETRLDFTAMKSALLALADSYGLPTDCLAPLDMLSIIERAAKELASAAQEEAFRNSAEDILRSFELPAAEHAQEIPPAMSVLSHLAGRNVRIGIVTRNCRPAAEIALRRVPLTHHLLLTRDDVCRTKPHPDQLLQALSLLEARPARSLMVGDHPMDVKGGRAAGMFTVGLLRPPHTPGRFASHQPDAIVHSLEELLSWT
ncbi:MAG: HAD family hydrolase [Armatimonadota bacterium]